MSTSYATSLRRIVRSILTDDLVIGHDNHNKCTGIKQGSICYKCPNDQGYPKLNIQNSHSTCICSRSGDKCKKNRHTLPLLDSEMANNNNSIVSNELVYNSTFTAKLITGLLNISQIIDNKTKLNSNNVTATIKLKGETITENNIYIEQEVRELSSQASSVKITFNFIVMAKQMYNSSLFIHQKALVGSKIDELVNITIDTKFIPAGSGIYIDQDQNGRIKANIRADRTYGFICFFRQKVCYTGCDNNFIWNTDISEHPTCDGKVMYPKLQINSDCGKHYKPIVFAKDEKTIYWYCIPKGFLE